MSSRFALALCALGFTSSAQALARADAPRIERAVCRGPKQVFALVDEGGRRQATYFDGRRARAITPGRAIGLSERGFFVELDGKVSEFSAEGALLETRAVPASAGALLAVQSVSAANAGAVWLAGRWSVETENEQFFIDDRVLVWNGREVKSISTEVRADNARARIQIAALDARRANDVWAVGGISTGANERGLILHYDGRRWTRIDSATPYPLTGVYVRSAQEIWLYGGSPLLGTAALYLHDGKKLMRKPVATPVAALCHDAAGVLWQVGYDGRVGRLDLPPAD